MHVVDIGFLEIGPESTTSIRLTPARLVNLLAIYVERKELFRSRKKAEFPGVELLANGSQADWCLTPLPQPLHGAESQLV